MEGTDNDGVRSSVGHERPTPLASRQPRGAFDERDTRSMTYLTKRCMTAPESPRDAFEVVVACANFGADPAADDVIAEPSLDSGYSNPVID